MDLSSLLDWLLDALLDTVRLLPFLYLCYLLLEFLEKHVDFTRGRIGRALRGGRVGPLVGGLCGVVPQCGFSTVAAGLYAGRVITCGTLCAVFLSTSDEMLPVLLSHQMPLPFILSLLLIKALVAIACGYLCDLLLRRHTASDREMHVEELCAHEGCHCEGHGIFFAALYHTAHIALFIFAATFVLNGVIGTVGEERLGELILHVPVVGHCIAALIGLIPNCAASVILTELYMAGALSFGSMLAGLLPGAGAGILVLCRANRRPKENILILLGLLTVGVLVGLLFDLIGVEGWLLSLCGMV